MGAVLRVSMVLLKDWTNVWKRNPWAVPEYTETPTEYLVSQAVSWENTRSSA